MSRVRALGPGLLFLAVFIAAFNLRPSISAVGPVLESLLEYLGASSAYGGVVTALPGIVFCVAGLSAVSVGKRLGLSGAIVVGACALTIGLLVRPFVPHPWIFLVLTALAIAGIAIGNVLLPAWIKVHGGARTVRLMTLYTVFLSLGGALGPSTAMLFGADDVTHAPIEGTLVSPAPWQWALAIWGLVALVQAFVWLPVWKSRGFDYPPDPPQRSSRGSIFRSPTAIALTAFFGLQSMNAYIQIGWAPSVFLDAGLDPTASTISTMLIHIMGIAGGLVMPTVIARSKRLWGYTVGFAALTGIGWILMIVLNARGAHELPVFFPYFAAIVLGVGGFCFPTAIALIPARTRDAAVTARLSAFVQPVGYILAAAGPLCVGVLVERAGWALVLWGLCFSSVFMALAGIRVGLNRMVDDEIEG